MGEGIAVGITGAAVLIAIQPIAIGGGDQTISAGSNGEVVITRVKAITGVGVEGNTGEGVGAEEEQLFGVLLPVDGEVIDGLTISTG